MARLRVLCEAAGCENARTYIASGNIVMDSALPAARLRKRLEKAIEEEFGFSIAVVVLTAAELAAVVRDNPFPGARPGTLHVAFAATPFSQADAAGLEELDFPPEELVGGQQIYFHLPNGYGRARLPTAIDRRVGKITTVRNWRTVVTLSEMASIDT